MHSESSRTTQRKSIRYDRAASECPILIPIPIPIPNQWHILIQPTKTSKPSIQPTSHHSSFSSPSTHPSPVQSKAKQGKARKIEIDRNTTDKTRHDQTRQDKTKIGSQRKPNPAMQIFPSLPFPSESEISRGGRRPRPNPAPRGSKYVKDK